MSEFSDYVNNKIKYKYPPNTLEGAIERADALLVKVTEFNKRIENEIENEVLLMQAENIINGNS